MKLLLICINCNSEYKIEFVKKDIPKFYIINTFLNGKITTINTDLSNVFNYDKYIQCSNCKCIEFNIQAIYN